MSLVGFDHVNVRTANLDAMIEWYVDVLGMTNGPRPGFPFPGAWLYLGDQAMVHLVGESDGPKNDDVQIEHFAFRAKGKAKFLKMLDEKGVACKIAVVPDFDITQVNIWDPDGNHLHIDFAPGDA